jgi:hypothetical protein
LELGPLDGRDTVPLVQHCESVVAIEGRSENVAATWQAMKAASLYNLTIHSANLENYELIELGRFDCVWASGILYHLPRPWELVRKIGGVTNLCLGWTHLATEMRNVAGPYGGWEQTEDDPATSLLSGLSGYSFWLTENEFVRMWADVGFSCRFYEPPQSHQNGGVAGQFIAERRDD